MTHDTQWEAVVDGASSTGDCNESRRTIDLLVVDGFGA
jgi:hypothetical protein